MEEAVKDHCPRCNSVLRNSAPVPEDETTFFPCPMCGWQFKRWAFRKHGERLRLKERGEQLLSDQPAKATKNFRAFHSLRERIAFRMRRPPAYERVLLRNNLFLLLQRCRDLALEYPALPRQLSSPNDVQAFWKDPHDSFKLAALIEIMSDFEHIAVTAFPTRAVRDSELRTIFLEVLPRCTWGGLAESFSMASSELRGFCLCLQILRALGEQLPSSFVLLVSMFREEGFNDSGDSLDVRLRADDM